MERRGGETGMHLIKNWLFGLLDPSATKEVILAEARLISLCAKNTRNSVGSRTKPTHPSGSLPRSLHDVWSL